MYKVGLNPTSSKTAENSITVIFIVFFGGGRGGPEMFLSDDVTKSM